MQAGTVVPSQMVQLTRRPFGENVPVAAQAPAGALHQLPPPAPIPDFENSVHDEDTAAQIVACSFLYQEDRLGFAWLDESRVVCCGEVGEVGSRKIIVEHDNHIVEDAEAVHLESVGFILRHLYSDRCAAAVVAPAKSHPALVGSLQRYAITPTFLHTNEFTSAKAMEHLAFMWPDRSNSEWSTKLDMTATVALGAVSGLLSQLQRIGERVADVENHAIQPLVSVPKSTLASLQVFFTEQHPGATYGLGKPKEGLSLFGLVQQKAKSYLGRDVLRRWFLLPTSNRTVLHQRLDGIESLQAATNQEVVTEILPHLRNIKQPLRIIDKISQQRHSISDYDSLLRCASSYLAICRLVPRLCGSGLNPIMNIVSRCHEPSVSKLVQLVSTIVDFDAPPSNSNGNRVCIRENVSPELDEVRETFKCLDMFLNEVAATQHRNASAAFPPEFRGPLRATFLPQLGYLLCAPKSELHAGNAPPGWEMLFTTGADSFFKNNTMTELDETVGDLHSRISDLQLNIRSQMDAGIMELAPALTSIRDVGELDALLALATTALQEGWSRPTITPESGICVKSGWHALLTRCLGAGASPVPFDFELGDTQNLPVLDSRNGVVELGMGGVHDLHDDVGDTAADAGSHPKRVTMITGANGSGKSVLLRAVGIIAFLTHIGSFVPARHAEVGLLHEILTCGIDASSGFGGGGDDVLLATRSGNVGWGGKTGNSAKKPLARGPLNPPELSSNFGRQLASMSGIFHRASTTSRSLILVDEFGRGTLSSDGIALFAAVIDSFLKRGPRSPLFAFTTHYTEIVSANLLVSSWHRMMHWLHMKVVVTREHAQSSTDNGDQFETLNASELAYMFVPEHCTEERSTSCAAACALAAGVPRAIVDRAREVAKSVQHEKKNTQQRGHVAPTPRGGDATTPSIDPAEAEDDMKIAETLVAFFQQKDSACSAEGNSANTAQQEPTESIKEFLLRITTS